MSAQYKSTGKPAGGAGMPFPEYYLAFWAALCAVVGIAPGRFLPDAFDSPGVTEVARVNRAEPWHEAKA